MVGSLRYGLTFLLLVAFSMTAYAQSSTDEIPAGAGGVCGSDIAASIDPAVALANTARLNPDLYGKIVSRDKNLSPRVQSAELGFFTLNMVTQSFDEVTAELVWEGRTSRIWVDKADVNDANRWKAIQAAIPALSRALDTATPSTSRNRAQGMIDNDNNVFGPAPTQFAADWEYKTNYLFTDIKDGSQGSGGYVAGYFYQLDQTDLPGSNRMNLLYIDSHEGISGGVTGLSGTIAHEFQHLIHYGINPETETVFNEGCSEVASILNGYRNRSSNLFLNNTNTSLFRWSRNDNTLVLNDYSRAMTLLHYLTEQYGEEFLTTFVATGSRGVARIGQALTAIGRNDTWQDVLKGFAVANYLQTYAADSRYGYKLRLGSTTAKAAKTFTGGAFPADTTISLQSYGSAYLVFSKPNGEVSFRFTSPSNKKYAVMAMLTRGSNTQVTELDLDTDYSFGNQTDGGAYDKVVVALVSLESTTQSVGMGTEYAPTSVSSVDDRGTASKGLSILGTSPNPASGPTSITFATAVSGAVTLQMFSSTGVLVRTVIDGERYEPGDHAVSFSTDGLPQGYYMIRLIEGNQVATRSMVVVK